MNVKTKASEAEIKELLETKGSMNDAEIQNLLDSWIRARRSVWDALFGLINANAPAPCKEIVDRSTQLYAQMVESVLEAQTAGLSTALRAFGPVNGMTQLVAEWGEGMRRIAETAVETQRKSGEVWSKAQAELTSTSRGKEAQAPSKAA
jgi:Phasin protein